MPSFVEIGKQVPEKKIFEGFLPYIGMSAILVTRPLASSSYRCFISNLALIGRAISEKKMFEYYGNIHVC